MGYAVAKVVNGSFAINSEHGDDKDGAKMGFWNLCTALTNASEAVEATVKLVDDKLDTVEGKVEFISHPAKA